MLRRLAICLILMPVVAFSQDSSWRQRNISPDVAISIPGPIKSIDTNSMKIVAGSENGFWMQARYFASQIVINSGDELIQQYEGFLKGYLENQQIKRYVTTVNDTIINGTTGEWIHHKYSQQGNYIEVYSYVVLVNRHFYMFVFSGIHPIDSGAVPALRKFYSSLRLLRQPVPEYSEKFLLQARSYRRGERWGIVTLSIIHWIAPIGAALVILFLVVRWKKSRNQRRG